MQKDILERFKQALLKERHRLTSLPIGDEPTFDMMKEWLQQRGFKPEIITYSPLHDGNFLNIVLDDNEKWKLIHTLTVEIAKSPTEGSFAQKEQGKKEVADEVRSTGRTL